MSKRVSKTIVGSIDREVLAFTAGEDASLDLNLVRYDCIGTAAHVTMLSRLRCRPAIISNTERKRVIRALTEIIALDAQCKFSISAADQDVHMAVERYLTSRLGEVGKKVHTARSRNDQSALDMRMFMRDGVLNVANSVADLASVLVQFAKRYRNAFMAGRTHFMPAMPSTAGLWASSYAEALLDDALMLKAVYQVLNKSPLGSAAGYGVPINIDRCLTARLLAFDAPVSNVVYAGSSRGKIEAQVLSCCSLAMMTLSRLAEDTILFAAPEFGYFRLPDDMCTGSSIMPQKKNPDVLELIRARASVVKGCAQVACDVVSKLPCGYSRDLQETKEPAMKGLWITGECMSVAAKLFAKITCNMEAMMKGLTDDVFATDLALKYVSEGMPFRSAYDRVKEELSAGVDKSVISAALAARRRLNQEYATGLQSAGKQIRELRAWYRGQCSKINKAEKDVLSFK